MVSFTTVMPSPWPSVTTSTTPRQKNCVPMVVTREGIPSLTTMKPFSHPANKPAKRQARKPRYTPSWGFVSLSAMKTRENAAIPHAMIDPKERSISFATTTNVNGIAIKAK